MIVSLKPAGTSGKYRIKTHCNETGQGYSSEALSVCDLVKLQLEIEAELENLRLHGKVFN